MTQVEQALRVRLSETGPLRFDEYMSLVLYELPDGYYQTHVPGEQGDYRTSPTLTPWFGRLVSRHVETLWRSLGSPEKYDLVEIGGGDGSLAEAFLESSSGRFAEALNWWFVEPFEQIQKTQRVRLSRFSNVHWVQRIEDLDPIEGAVLANEVLDNFPVRVFEVSDGEALEVWVGADEKGKLAEHLRPIQDPIPMRVELALKVLEDGDRFEISDHIEQWCERLSAVLRKGHCILIDYGASEPEMWTQRPAGTLVTYRQGQLGVDPLSSPGEADITAHVNFAHLISCMAPNGIVKQELKTQREWLLDIGLDKVSDQIRSEQMEAASSGDHGSTVGLLAERGRVEALAARGGLGDLLVFIGAKGLP